MLVMLLLGENILRLLSAGSESALARLLAAWTAGQNREDRDDLVASMAHIPVHDGMSAIMNLKLNV